MQDPTDWISLAVNAVISVLCSWAVAAYYFRKVTRSEDIADQIRYGLQRSLLPILYPQLFDDQTVWVIHPVQRAPKNLDVPHVEYARIGPRPVWPGQRIDVLIKVRDEGYDLENPGGISVLDHEGKPVGVVAIGLGFCRCRVHIGQQTMPGDYDLTVELVDEGAHVKPGRNRNVQTLPFIVEGRLTDDRSNSSVE